MAQWEFAPGAAKESVVASKVGDFGAAIEGTARLVSAPFPALVFSQGETSVTVPVLDQSKLPKRDLSVEAWVCINEGTEWGGIAGYVQDNGDFEKGWLLGYDQSRFSFAVSASDGRLKYLKSQTAFEKGRWHHVAGTYDGETMRIYVDGRLEALSSEQSGDIQYPPKAVFAIGAYRDDDEFFKMDGSIHAVAVSAEAVRSQVVENSWTQKKSLIPLKLTVTRGPVLRFVSPDAAEIRWQASEAKCAIIEWGEGETPDRTAEAVPDGSWIQARIAGLKPKLLYHYRIKAEKDGRQAFSDVFEMDNAMNFTVHAVPSAPSPFEPATETEALGKAAEQILENTGVRDGLCLVIGNGTGRLAYELACRSNLRIIGADDDADRINAARRALQQADVYGWRISLFQADDLSRLPFPEDFANLVVSERAISEGKWSGDASSALRMLKPGDGIAVFGSPNDDKAIAMRPELESWLASSDAEGRGIEACNGTWAFIRKDTAPDVGSWTHQYANAANNAQSGEGLDGIIGAGDLEARWIGRPGADFGIDRNPRMPAPLAANGRLFHQGMNRLLAMDSCNGAILWSLEIPALRRVNIPRDACNWCCDDDRLFVAIGDACWTLDAASGGLLKTTPLPEASLRATHEWGYVGREDGLLFGSSVWKGSACTDFWGGPSWYDATSGQGTEKICSNDLFAINDDGGLAWRYGDAVIINTTIAINDGKVYFVECRNPELKALRTGRIGSEKLWSDQFLVALDAKTGRKLWEAGIDTADGVVTFYLICNDDAILIAPSAGGMYHLYCYDPADGKPRWQASHKWPNDNHGGHMQHPVIVGETVYLEPCGYDLKTGKQVTDAMGRHEGCATYAGTLHGVVYRGRGRIISIWDARTGESGGWAKLRPSCWLSVVPANGMVLAPEGGGGCSCGEWMETSVGFAPIPIRAPRFSAPAATFLDAITVSLDTVHSGAAIRYTLDGTEPTEKSPQFAAPLTLSETTTVCARTFMPGGGMSAVARRTFSKTPAREPDRPEKTAPGLRYDYYEIAAGEKLPDFSKITPKEFGVTNRIDTGLAMRGENIIFRFTGYIVVEKDGIYRFYTESDDGSRLWIGDQLVVDNDGLHGKREKSGEIALKAGLHRITVGYFQGDGSMELSASYEGPGLPKQAIPEDVMHKDE